MKITLILLLFFGNNFSQFYFLPASNGEILPKHESYIAQIDLEKNGMRINVVGKFFNHTDSTIFIEYKMQTTKIGKSGKTNSIQSGKYSSEPKSELVLNRIGLNIDNEMRYSISLKVFSEDILIAEDLLNYSFE